MFGLHPRLQQDCVVLRRLELCQLLLMNDANFPWFILVPEREGVSEIYQLGETDQHQLLAESSMLCDFIQQNYQSDKLNVAVLGNIVPQLHMHHIARFTGDACWPKPVWGQLPAVPYSEQELASIHEQVNAWWQQHSG